MDTVTIELIGIAILICLTGFFSMAEFAIISVRKSLVAQQIADGDDRATIIADLQRDPHTLLAVVQIGITITTSAASTIGGIVAIEHARPFLQQLPWPYITHLAEPIAAIGVVAVVSYITLIIGELVPKSLGLQYAHRVSFALARPIRLFSYLTTPITIFLTGSSKAVFWLLRLEGAKETFVTREEVQHMVTEGQETGVFSEAEHEYIQNVFEFTHTCVREVLVPRTRMVALAIDAPTSETLAILLESQYSRYPVYRERLEDIVGIVHDKDIMAILIRGEELHLEQIMRPVRFVPEGKKVNDLLKDMQRSRTHMAIVVDEYGGLAGLVTTEDLLEELVGEIQDEHDAGDTHPLQRQSDGSWVVDGATSIFDICETLDIKLEGTMQVESIAGLILNELGHLPQAGESISWHGYRLICEQVTRTAITVVRIVALSNAPPTATGA